MLGVLVFRWVFAVLVDGMHILLRLPGDAETQILVVVVLLLPRIDGRL